MHDDYSLECEVPDTGTYLDLRRAGGLRPFPAAAVEAGLQQSWHAVILYSGEKPVGMGRIVGDGGCFFQIVDIVVHPEHQRKGLGKTIMRALINELEDRAPKGAYVSLIADVPADELYAQFGFVATAPRSIGMARRI